MNGDPWLAASAISALPSLGIGLIVALIDPDDGHPVLVGIVVFALMAAAMVQVFS